MVAVRTCTLPNRQFNPRVSRSFSTIPRSVQSRCYSVADRAAHDVRPWSGNGIGLECVIGWSGWPRLDLKPSELESTPLSPAIAPMIVAKNR